MLEKFSFVKSLKEKSLPIRRKIKETISLPTDRDIHEYEKYLGLNLSGMKGDLVLDIGSSNTETFSKQAAELGIKVVSINPKLKKERIRNKITTGPKNSVAGRAQEMPFTDNVFDYEVALFSVPVWIPSDFEEYKKFFSEIVRTLKPGGKGYIFPVVYYKKDFIRENNSELLPKDKVSYEFQNVPNEQYLYRLILTKKSAQ